MRLRSTVSFLRHLKCGGGEATVRSEHFGLVRACLVSFAASELQKVSRDSNDDDDDDGERREPR